MNTKKFETTLQKLNDLFTAIQRNPGEVSPIERDLLRNYLMNLYDLSLKSYQKEKGEFKKSKKSNKKNSAPSKPSPKAIPDETENIAGLTAPVENDPGSNDIGESVAIGKEPLIDPELEALFEEIEVKELSDKLSLSPLVDLAKSMGINEKIFTIQELFGGDQQIFDATLKDLNNMTDFKQAKTLLIGGVASKYEWAKADKKKKAKTFIQYIRRKFV